MGGFIAGVTFVLICVTAAHEWGYFLSIGRHFQAMMQPSDYLVSSIYWLPPLAVVLVLGALKDVAILRADNFRSLDDFIAAAPSPRIARFVHYGPNWLMALALSLLSAWQIVWGNPYQLTTAGLLAAIVWMCSCSGC